MVALLACGAPLKTPKLFAASGGGFGCFCRIAKVQIRWFCGAFLFPSCCVDCGWCVVWWIRPAPLKRPHFSAVVLNVAVGGFFFNECVFNNCSQ